VAIDGRPADYREVGLMLYKTPLQRGAFIWCHLSDVGTSLVGAISLNGRALHVKIRS